MSTASEVPFIDIPLRDPSFTGTFLKSIIRYGGADSLGSVIASVCGNSIDILLTYLAAIDLGGIVVPVNPASKQCKSWFLLRNEIENYLTMCNVQYVLTESHYAKRMTDILNQSKPSSISMILLEELSEADHDEQQLKAGAEISLQPASGDTITTINIVPPILEFLVKHPLVNSFDLSSLRSVYVGAAKSDENLLRCLKHRLPGLRDIIQLFGMTETGMLIFVTPSANSILSSVGRAMPGVKAKVVNDDGKQLGPNEIGQLLLQSPTMMQGYLGEEE
ncbi:unnamed protein product [Angiostrongylus costaricensis]|uniref:AMP-binding domain-containing protein n=1 Tax=Angiostrongylus costaricensis TaxID=334426 RepID=A0A0R3PJQ5_ANGCS|nr:unnamed protein product [Angiostrongylus costaricensis]